MRVRLGLGPLLSIVLIAGGCSSSSPLPVSVSVTSNAQGIDQASGLEDNIKATVANDVGGKGVTWTLNGAGALTCTSCLTTSYVPPTSPLLAAPQQVTVTAISVADPTQHASVQITVNPYPAINAGALPVGTAGVPYGQSIPLAGGTAPFRWSIYGGGLATGAFVGGSLPAGLTLNAATGAIVGTPTAAGTWYFEATMTDADGETAIDGFVSLQINPSSAAKGNPAPFVDQSLKPSAISPGSGSTTLSVSGAGFVSGATIAFNGTPLATTFVDGDHLTAALPASDLAVAQTASITVVNPAPGGGSSNVVFFHVVAPESAVNFSAAPNLPLPLSEAFGLAVADLNRDGRPDLVIAANITVNTLLSNGDGTFTAGANSPVYVPSPPYDNFASPYVGPLAVGDFTRSGNLGVAAAEINNLSAIILPGDGKGGLLASSAGFAYEPGFALEGIATADFNADGYLDLAVAQELSGNSQIQLGYGGGAFNPGGSYPTGSAVAIGDINRDGKLDLAVAAGNTVYILLGNGDGTFTQKAGSPITIGSGDAAIVTADFDGDGMLDLAVGDESGNAVYVLIGNGDGTFKPATSTGVGVGPSAMVAGDFNGDGKLDIATSNYGAGTVTLLLGGGNGTFTPSAGSPYAVGKGPGSIVAADFNGDGRLDLAVANGLAVTGTVSVLLQK